MFAEKLLANADSGLDRAVLSRDIIDIAMMVRHWGDIPRTAWDKVRKAYGASAVKMFEAAQLLIEDRRYHEKCLDQMSIDRSGVAEIPSILGDQLKLLRREP